MNSEVWKTVKLNDAIEALLDYRGKTPKKTTSGIPLVTAKIVKDGFVQEPTEFIAEEDYSNWMTRGMPKIGDVVLTVEAPLGEVAQLTDNRIALAQRIVTLRGKKNVLDNGYLKYFLQSETGQARLRARETGTTVTGIKQSELRLVEIEIPSFTTQLRIASILSSLDDKIELNRQTNKTLEAIAQALFKEWFVAFNYPGATGEMQESELGEIPKGWR
ncbi:MAG: restriction endonuclease subunit S, partial [Proteobacteria bacterium]